MPVPTYDRFIEPLLRYLATRHEGAPTADAHAAVATRLGLTAEDCDERLPSGIQPLYKNRNGWAQDRLKRAGLSFSPRNGFWKLTPEGVAYEAGHRAISKDELEGLTGAVTSAHSSPEERIETAIAELRESVARDLLELIGRAPPELFESLILDLLHAMGYGTNRSDVQRVGGSGDGSIDGVISLDRLGLEKVYVQAKRWKRPVGGPEIQTFMGALQLQSAAKGVFITTSLFTKEVKVSAARARGTIVLVDGALLTSLMMDHGVAVSHKLLRIPKVDNDYFEDA